MTILFEINTTMHMVARKRDATLTYALLRGDNGLLYFAVMFDFGARGLCMRCETKSLDSLIRKAEEIGADGYQSGSAYYQDGPDDTLTKVLAVSYAGTHDGIIQRIKSFVDGDKFAVECAEERLEAFECGRQAAWDTRSKEELEDELEMDKSWLICHEAMLESFEEVLK